MVPLIEYAAVVSAAIYAVGLAARHGMDPVGTLATAFAVSFGGGTLRDLFLDRHPLFWVANERYVAVVLAIGLAGCLAPRAAFRLERWITVPDALGLGLFAVAGTAVARAQGAGPVVSALLGVVTGTFGGVIGDVICNRVPSLFRPAPLYATCAFAGAWCYLGAVAAGADPAAAQPAAVAAVVALRLIAVRRDWVMRPVGGAAIACEPDAHGPDAAPEPTSPPPPRPARRSRRRLRRADRRR